MSAPPVHMTLEELVQHLWIRQEAAAELQIRSIRRQESLRQAVLIHARSIGNLIEHLGRPGDQREADLRSQIRDRQQNLIELLNRPEWNVCGHSAGKEAAGV